MTNERTPNRTSNATATDTTADAGRTAISWRVARPGTPVYGPADERIGLLREVEADDNEDIFHGLVVDLGGAEPLVLVPRDDVTAIEDRRIDIGLTRDEVRQLPPYTSAGASVSPPGGLDT